MMSLRRERVLRGEMKGHRMGELSCHQLRSGANLVTERLEETFVPWLERTTAAMIPLLHPPISREYQAPPIIALPQPLYRLENVTSAATIPVSTSDGTATAHKKQVKASFQDGDDVLEPGWVWTTLKRNKRVTAEGWFQDVREIELELEEPFEYVDWFRMFRLTDLLVAQV